MIFFLYFSNFFSASFKKLKEKYIQSFFKNISKILKIHKKKIRNIFLFLNCEDKRLISIQLEKKINKKNY